MKKKWMKFTSMLLAAVMVLSMAMTGLAAEIEPMSSSTDTTFSITVTNTVDGETYNAYKIFDVTYDDDNYSYTIDSSNDWYNIVSAATNVFTLTQISGTTIYNVSVNEGVEDDDIIAVFTEAGVPEGAEADATATAEDGKAYLNLTSSGPGYYYVTTTLGSLVIIDTTNPTQEIEEKNGIPEIVKTERDVQFDPDNDWHGTGEGELTDTSANGDTMQYRLIISNIHDVNELVIHDYMDSQLVLSSVTIDSITIVDGATTTALVEGTDYTYNDTNTCGGEKSGMDGCSFEITIDPEVLIGLSSNAYLEIIYNVTISEDSDSFGTDLTDEIDNEANVTFGAAGEGTPSKVETFSFGFNVFKYTGSEEPLAGAEFVLKNSEGQYAVFNGDEEDEGEGDSEDEGETPEDSNVYLLTKWVDSIDDATVIITPEDGKFVIEGLHDGTYYLEETAAPDGYNKLTSDIKVSIDATGAVRIDDAEEPTSDKTVDVVNNSGTILPGTGGMGTTLFYIVGIVLMIGAAAFFVARKRISKEG